MGVKLNKETSDVIHVSQMKDGQIAEVVEHKITKNIGLIIQRIDSVGVFIIGKGLNFFNHVEFDGVQHCKVRILKNGETLTITDNE